MGLLYIQRCLCIYGVWLDWTAVYRRNTLLYQEASAPRHPHQYHEATGVPSQHRTLDEAAMRRKRHGTGVVAAETDAARMARAVSCSSRSVGVMPDSRAIPMERDGGGREGWRASRSRRATGAARWDSRGGERLLVVVRGVYEARSLDSSPSSPHPREAKIVFADRAAKGW